MEDDRGKFIVIAAGYKKEMQGFLDSNPGLMSRFTKFIEFEDYSPNELSNIFLSIAESQKFSFSENFKKAVLQKTTEIFQNRDKNFANGRTIRNLFETTKQKQANRIAVSGTTDKQSIFTLLEEDLP